MTDPNATLPGASHSNGKRSRLLEDIAFMIAMLQAVAFGAAETAARVGFYVGEKPPESGIPYMSITIFLGCVAPKMLGRATAGKIWERIPFLNK